jgi:hypothetical protein
VPDVAGKVTRTGRYSPAEVTFANGVLRHARLVYAKPIGRAASKPE